MISAQKCVKEIIVDLAMGLLSCRPAVVGYTVQNC